MSIKSRLPQELKDERSMRVFLDRLDRNHVKTGEISDLDTATATTTDLATAFNTLLAIYRSK